MKSYDEMTDAEREVVRAALQLVQTKVDGLKEVTRRLADIASMDVYEVEEFFEHSTGPMDMRDVKDFLDMWK